MLRAGVYDILAFGYIIVALDGTSAKDSLFCVPWRKTISTLNAAVNKLRTECTKSLVPVFTHLFIYCCCSVTTYPILSDHDILFKSDDKGLPLLNVPNRIMELPVNLTVVLGPAF
jgi:hypothetical protein